MTLETFNVYLAVGGAPAVIAAVGYTAHRLVHGESLIPWSNKADGLSVATTSTKEQVSDGPLVDSNAH